MKKVVAIIQARMDSSRLPGKVLIDLGGKPLLQWSVERSSRARTVNDVVVATTDHPSDDSIFEYCRSMGYQVERGSNTDVLDRYYQTAKKHQANIIVRLTADCPLIDPKLIDEAVYLLLKGTGSNLFDFVTNRLPAPWVRTYPIGLDVELFTSLMLEEAWKKATAEHHREHVTPYFYEGTPVNQLEPGKSTSNIANSVSANGFRIALMHHSPAYGHLRWTVDTPEDLELLRAINNKLPDDHFSWTDILNVLQEHPELTEINAHIQHKNHLDVDDRYH